MNTASPPQKKEGSLFIALLIVGLPIGGLAFVANGGLRSARPGGPLDPVAAFRQPETLVSQTVVLREGNAMSYSFTLPSERRIDVAVTATPRVVNVILLREDQWQRYQQVHGSLFGGQYQYVQRLSSQSVTQFRDSAPLSAGAWRIVVERPSEAVLFGDDTSATVSIISN